MKVAERATPAAAVVAALSALACCMPLGFLGALGLAGFGLWAAKYKLLFTGLAFGLLVLGFVQVYRGRQSCRTRSTASVITFWIAVALVLLIFLFPQLIASVLAGWNY
jgi:hypothetical protein